jgi:F-box domain.
MTSYEDLPTEIKLEILINLNINILVALREISKSFNSYISDVKFIRRKVKYDIEKRLVPCCVLDYLNGIKKPKAIEDLRSSSINESTDRVSQTKVSSSRQLIHLAIMYRNFFNIAKEGEEIKIINAALKYNNIKLYKAIVDKFKEASKSSLFIFLDPSNKFNFKVIYENFGLEALKRHLEFSLEVFDVRATKMLLYIILSPILQRAISKEKEKDVEILIDLSNNDMTFISDAFRIAIDEGKTDIVKHLIVCRKFSLLDTTLKKNIRERFGIYPLLLELTYFYN